MKAETVEVECKTAGFEEAQEKIEALASAYDGFLPKCKFNIVMTVRLIFIPVRQGLWRIAMSEKKSSGGIGFTGLLQIAFIVLKLCKVINWTWFWVLSPLWISAVLPFYIDSYIGSA